jgi:hypothetical protein
MVPYERKKIKRLHILKSFLECSSFSELRKFFDGFVEAALGRQFMQQKSA